MDSKLFAYRMPRESLKTLNQTSAPESADSPQGTAASVFALWILIPLALGAFAYIVIGLALMLSPYEPGKSVDPRLWIFLTVVFQAIYWVFLADKKRLGALKGLWALLPLVGLVPTFSIARAADEESALSRHDQTDHDDYEFSIPVT